MTNRLLEDRLLQIRAAYDLTVEQAEKGIDPMAELPEEIRSSAGYKYLMENRSSVNSAAPDIREYLDPKPQMRFLDAGCCANLHNYRLDRWPSTYYGIDNSPRLIEAMKNFASRVGISTGGLYLAEIVEMPFADDFFDIGAAIGLLEYYPLEYIQDALRELNRVLKPGSRVVLDMPNRDHRYVADMAGIERYLGRPNLIFPRLEFEKLLEPFFFTERTDDSQVMIKYYIRTRK